MLFGTLQKKPIYEKIILKKDQLQEPVVKVNKPQEVQSKNYDEVVNKMDNFLKSEYTKKFEEIMQKISGFDDILLDLKKKQEVFFTNFGNKQVQPIPIPIYPQEVQKPPVEKSVKEPKKICNKKKKYEKMPPELAKEKTLKYTNFPQEYLNNIYTTNGEDIYVDLGKKKIEIANGAHVLRLINLKKNT